MTCVLYLPHYECVPHKRVGVTLQTTVETLYVNHGIDLNNFVWLLLCDHQHKKKTAGGLAAFTSYYEESDRGHTITAKKPD